MQATMNIEIKLEKVGDAYCTISNSENKGHCWIEVKEGNQSLAVQVTINELRTALRKLCAT